MNKEARRRRNVHNEIEKPALFMNRLILSIQKTILRFWQSTRCCLLFYEKFVQYCRGEKNSNFARIVSIWGAKSVSPNPQNRGGQFFEPRTIDNRSVEDDTKYYVLANGFISTDAHPSTLDTPSSMSVTLVANKQNKLFSWQLVKVWSEQLAEESRDTFTYLSGLMANINRLFVTNVVK